MPKLHEDKEDFYFYNTNSSLETTEITADAIVVSLKLTCSRK
jgi:hypothetical protein